MELTDEQVNSLTSGGDTELHSHMFDRTFTHDHVDQFHRVEKDLFLAGSASLDYSPDYVFVDSSSGAVALSLPPSRGGKIFTIVRTSGANGVTLNPVSPDTVNGSSTLSITSSYSPVRIRGISGKGWIQV